MSVSTIPYLHIQLGVQVTPSYAACMVYNKCRVDVPEAVLHESFSEELKSIISLYQNHIESDYFGDNLKRHAIGFKYHREHDVCLIFDADLVLVEKVFTQEIPHEKKLLGNRLANLLTGGSSITTTRR